MKNAFLFAAVLLVGRVGPCAAQQQTSDAYVTGTRQLNTVPKIGSVGPSGVTYTASQLTDTGEQLSYAGAQGFAATKLSGTLTDLTQPPGCAQFTGVGVLTSTSAACGTGAGGGGGATLTPNALLFGTSFSATRAAQPADITALFGYTFINPANNGSDFASPATVRTNIGAAPLASPSFTGTVTLPGNPIAALQAAPKQYVDAGDAVNATAAANASTAASNAQTTANNALPSAGGTLTGPLTLAADPTTNLQAATKHYADVLVNGLLPYSGGTLTGPLTLAADPTLNAEAATKNYVDAQLAPVATSASNAANIAGAAQTTANNALPKAGGALTGFVTASSDTPTGAQLADANYVNNQISPVSTVANRANANATSALSLATNAIQVSGGNYTSGTTYPQGALAFGSDGANYAALGPNSGNHDPVSTTGYWVKIAPAPGSVIFPGTTANAVATTDGSGHAQTDPSFKDAAGVLTFVRNIGKLPRVDATHPDFGADPSGVADSTASVNAAFRYAEAQGASTSSLNMQYPVYLPPGVYSILGTLQMNSGDVLFTDQPGDVILKAGNGSQSTIYVAFHQTSGDNTPSTVISGITINGSGHLNTGNAIEIDGNRAVLNDVKIYNWGGRGIQQNFGERWAARNVVFYNVRLPWMLGGDDNEGKAWGIAGIANGATNESVSNSGFFTYCYGPNCHNGIFPLANQGTASSSGGVAGTSAGTYATPIVSPNRGAIVNEKSVNVSFDFGGDMKDNHMQAGFQNIGGTLTNAENLYVECSVDTPWQCTTPSLLVGGGMAKALVSGSSAQTSFTANGSTYYEIPVAPALQNNARGGDDMGMYYGSLQQLKDTNDSDYNPVVIVPSDFTNPSDTTASVCTGLNKGSYEVINLAQFYPNISDSLDHLVIRGRVQQNYPTANANYDWSTNCPGAMVEDFNGPSQSPTTKFANFHANSFSAGSLSVNAQTNSGSSGYVVVSTNEHPLVDAGLGIFPDDSPNGFYKPFNTSGFNTGLAGKKDAYVPRTTFGNPIEMGNTGGSLLQHGSIVCVGPCATSLDAMGPRDPNAGIIHEPYATNTVTAANAASAVGTGLMAGMRMVNIFPETGGNQFIAMPDANGNPVPSNLLIPGISEWSSFAGYSLDNCFNNPGTSWSNFVCGKEFFDDYWVFAQPPAGPAKPVGVGIHLAGGPNNTGTTGTAPRFDVVNMSTFGAILDATLTGITANQPIYANGGIQSAVDAYDAGAAVTITQATRNYRFAPPVGGAIYTLPACGGTNKGEIHQFTIDATGNTFKFSAASQFNVNYVNLAGISQTANAPRRFETECDGVNWASTTYFPEAGAVMVGSTGAGLGGTVVASAVASSTVASSTFSATSTATGTANSAAFNITFQSTLSTVPNGCAATPVNAAAAAYSWFAGAPTASGVVIYTASSLPAASGVTVGSGLSGYVVHLMCQ